MSKQVDWRQVFAKNALVELTGPALAVVVELQYKKERKAGRVCTISKNVEVTQKFPLK